MQENEEFKPAQSGQFWEFPIEAGTDIIQGKNFMREHCHNGLAMVGHEGEVAEFGGWDRKQAPRLIGTQNWKDGGLYFKSNDAVLWVLKSRLIMN